MSRRQDHPWEPSGARHACDRRRHTKTITRTRRCSMTTLSTNVLQLLLLLLLVCTQEWNPQTSRQEWMTPCLFVVAQQQHHRPQNRSARTHSRTPSSLHDSIDEDDENDDEDTQQQQQQQQQQHTANPSDPLEIHQKALSLLFPHRQPRHVAEGAIHLAQSVATGLGLGVVSVLALPVAGFRQGGVLGLAAGSVAGTLYGTIFVLAGLVHGVSHMVRGAWQTPRAVRAARRGERWNGQTQRWSVYYLREEFEELAEREGRLSLDGGVKDDGYYRLLGVTPVATAKEIKRAYHSAAREVHPDKNPNDKDAAQRFLHLHTVYSVLSDRKQRDAYDRWGPVQSHDGDSNQISDVPNFDPHVFYAILFHTEPVQDYVGDLTVASFTASLLQLLQVHGGQDIPPDQVLQLLFFSPDHGKRQRQLDIAMFLHDRVHPYVQGTLTVGDFRTSAAADAARILDDCPHGWGAIYLRAIGTALVDNARQFLAFHQSNSGGWLVAGPYAWVQTTASRTKGMLTIVRETMDVLKLLPAYQKEVLEEDRTGTSTRTDEERMEEILPELLDVAWAYNAQDIRQTLRGACTRLFKDASANSKYKRLERAEAVMFLGQEFVLAATRADQEEQALSDDARTAARRTYMARVEVAMELSVMKATGQDTPKQNPEDMIKQRKRKAR